MNPYKVLGVSENATPEEIRAAYLTLVKKYHPDKYTENALKEIANERLKQINQAYEMITKKPEQAASAARNPASGGARPGASTGYGGARPNASASSRPRSASYSGPYAEEFLRVRGFIDQNNLQAAGTALDRIQTHNAEWYYLYSIVYFRQGWYERARECSRKAYESAPDNMEYRQAYRSFSNAGTQRKRTYETAGDVGNSVCCGAGPSALCCTLMCADCCSDGFCCPFGGR